MSRNKFTLLFLFLFLKFETGYAQFNIKEGPVLDLEKNAEFDRVIGSDDNAFYVYRIKTRGAGTHYFVEKYDRKNLNMIFSKDLDLEEYPGASLDPRSTNTWTILGSDKVYVFFPVYSKKDKSKILALRSVTKSGTVEPYKEIATNEDKEASFYVRVSPDSSKFLIINELQKAGQPQDVKATLYNVADFTKLWSKKIPDGYKKSGIRTANYLVYNDGAMAFYFNYMKDFDTKEVGGAIGMMKNDNDETSAVDLDFDSPMEIYTGLISFGKNNTLCCAGLFKDNQAKAKKKKKIPEMGVFYYILDIANMSLKYKGTEYFPKEVNDELTYSNVDGKTPLEKFYSSSSLQEIDGNFYFFAEHSYDIGSNKVRRELITSKINGQEGKIDWTKLLQKSCQNQSGQFNILKHNDRFYVLCLEHPSIEKKLAEGKSFKQGDYPSVIGISGPNVLAYEISESGKISRHIIYKNEDFCYQPQSQDVQLKSDNDLLIYMKKGGKEKFGIFTVN